MKGISEQDIGAPDFLNIILRYLPIDDDEEVVNYINKITATICLNYNSGDYQMAYFNTYFLFMLYVYLCVWKISQVYKDRFEDAVIHMKTYKGETLKYDEIKFIFEYSKIPDKAIVKLFKLIGLDESYIEGISKMTDTRNNMAHASNEFWISDERSFNDYISPMLAIFKNVNIKMTAMIKLWYRDILIRYANGEYETLYGGYEEVINAMTSEFSLSTNELLICKEFSLQNHIRTIGTYSPEQMTKMKQMHKCVRKLAEES